MSTPTLTDRLAPLLAPRTALRAAPLWTVCILSGAAIGAAVAGLPLMTGALGGVLLALATNIGSSAVYDLIKPNLDDEQRAGIIEQGLKAGDPQIKRFLAQALVAAAPDLAQALPASERTALAQHIGAGLNASGGVAAQIAASIQQALITPPADWAEFQRGLQQQIASVQLTMETSDEAEMRRNRQRVEQAAGPVVLSMKASGKSKMEDNEQVVIGTAAATPTPVSLTPPLRDPALNDPAHLQHLIDLLVDYVQIRETQAATLGSAATKQQLDEIAEFTAKIAALRARLVR